MTNTTQRSPWLGVLICILAALLALPGLLGLTITLIDKLNQGRVVSNPDGTDTIHLSGTITAGGTPVEIWHMVVWIAGCLALFGFGLWINGQSKTNA